MKLHELLKNALERYESLADDKNVVRNLGIYYVHNTDLITMCLAGGYAHFEKDKYKNFFENRYPDPDYYEEDGDLEVLSYLSHGSLPCSHKERDTVERIVGDIDTDIFSPESFPKVNEEWFSVMWKIQEKLEEAGV